MEPGYYLTSMSGHAREAVNAGGMPRIIWALRRVGFIDKDIAAIVSSRTALVNHWRNGRQGISPPKLRRLIDAARAMGGHLRNEAQRIAPDDELGEILFDMLEAEARLLEWCARHPERHKPGGVL